MHVKTIVLLLCVIGAVLARPEEFKSKNGKTHASEKERDEHNKKIEAGLVAKDGSVYETVEEVAKHNENVDAGKHQAKDKSWHDTKEHARDHDIKQHVVDKKEGATSLFREILGLDTNPIKSITGFNTLIKYLYHILKSIFMYGWHSVTGKAKDANNAVASGVQKGVSGVADLTNSAVDKGSQTLGAGLEAVSPPADTASTKANTNAPAPAPAVPSETTTEGGTVPK